MSAIRQILVDAAAHHRAGRVAEAEAGYRQALAAMPEHADALHLLGVLCHQTGRSGEAVTLIGRALEADPSCADFHSNLGEALRAAGRRADAEAAYRRAIALEPAHAAALTNLGLTLSDLGRHAEAAEILRRAIAAAPGLAVAHDNLGIALQGLGDLDGAAQAHGRAIDLAPRLVRAHNNLGNVHFMRRQLDQAEACYRRALAIDPDFPQAHYNLGNLHLRRGAFDAARRALEGAVALKPDYEDAQLNLASALQEQGLSNRARDLLEGLLCRRPDNAAARFALSGTLASLGDFAGSEAAFRRAASDAPGQSVHWSNFLYSLHYRPDLEPVRLTAIHREYEPAIAAARPTRTHTNTRDPGRRLRVGYVSPDFRTHSCAYFASPLLAAHDRRAVELFAYAELVSPDRTTDRFRSVVDTWRETTGRTDIEVADQIWADGIDILVDLAGHTAGNRLPVFARKPAPVQVTWLGYPGTTGLSAIDYRMTDAIADPPGAEAHAVETLIRLPGGFLCYEPAPDCPPLSPLPARSRRQVTFGCFNNAVKLNPGVARLWSAVLRAVPGARLLVKASKTEHDDSQRRLSAMFAAAGAPAGSVEVLRRYGDALEHFSTFAEVDIALDPFPYNGTTTTCETLWFGVPTITLRGDRHAGRVGASLLTAVGLPELIAETPDDYVARAAALAHDLDRLAGLRAGLRARMRASPLMDARAFARSVESAYRTMWRTWCGSPQ